MKSLLAMSLVLCSALAVQAAKPDVQSLQLLHFDRAAATRTSTALAARGIVVLAHLGEAQVLVSASPTAILELPGLNSAEVWSGRRAVTNLCAAAAHPEKRHGTALIVVGFAPDTPCNEIVEAARRGGAVMNWCTSGNGIPQAGLQAPWSGLDRLASELGQRRDLVFADLQPRVALRNSASTWRCQSGEYGRTPAFDNGLDGVGQVIAVMDTGIDVDSCYFYDPVHGLPPLNDDLTTRIDENQRKVLAVDFHWARDWPEPSPHSWDDHGHGSHVAASVAGDSSTMAAHEGADGMAPAAKLVIQDGGFRIDPCGDLPGLGCPMKPLEPMLEQAWAQGARIHSNSWGDEENARPPNRYTERTADFDRFVWHHEDMLVVAAAGNGGNWGNDTVASPGTGKNVLAVGATIHGRHDPPCPTGFSARGWTHDGRIKPDVVAPGQDIDSAATDYSIETFNCTTQRMSGTSMACPTVAGLAALVRQYFTDGFHPSGRVDDGAGFGPSAALVKATLIASAVDISSLGCSNVDPIPSRGQGWGLVQLDNALYFAGDSQRLFVHDERGGLDRGDTLTVEFRTTTNAPLKAVLVWTDPPSSSLAGTNLVNDLDLVVEGPDGIYVGNVFAGGQSVTGGHADRLNNVEVISLADAATGRWTCSVTADAVIDGPQNFAIVITGALRAGVSRNPGAARRFSSRP